MPFRPACNVAAAALNGAHAIAGLAAVATYQGRGRLNKGFRVLKVLGMNGPMGGRHLAAEGLEGGAELRVVAAREGDLVRRPAGGLR
eukprot:1179367-Prorocentrum_minimum.AAC.2